MNIDEITALNNIVRIGTVSSVDVEKRCVRVVFHNKKDNKGKPLVSGWLRVIQNQPLIVFKRWETDASEEGEAPNEIKKINITEKINPDYLGIYHSADRKLDIGEKYAQGEIADIRQYEVEPGVNNMQEIHETVEPDYIKNISDKTLIKVYPWLPYVKQLVVCLYFPNGESDGVVIGGL